jgi:hypothetical protein
LTQTVDIPHPRDVTDFAASARSLSRAKFVAAFPSSFLVGTIAYVRSRRAEKTLGLLDDEEEEEARVAKNAGSFESRTFVRPSEERLTVFRIRKMTAVFPDMITVGRTGRNDIVLEQHQISGFHACFRASESGGGLVLADAGSRNGTWVSGQLLEPKGPPSGILASGDKVSFAQLEFTFLNAAACWDVLRVTAK